ncbi:GGDEF domain-containing protein [Nakamurella sp. A5-74]|uniref:GGDEF domain-containing protein n=1 Tax=Nakamurella sp. A5-74 TaxID=3158264 RepID=A0AAU8DPZ6_9ACTN
MPGAITKLMDLIVSGAALTEVLDTLARTVEKASPGTVCSILLLDEDRLLHGAAPSLPLSFWQPIDGATIGPSVGSCGTAAYTRETVIVTDIASDPLWDDFRELALSAGFRACWSVPIIDGSQRVLGTFALYYREVRAPSQDDLGQMTRWVNMAEVAISRVRFVAALRGAAAQDALTGLMNRTEALRVLTDLTRTATAGTAVLFVDLDQFKFVNDTLGHAAGDQYLTEVARRLTACARDTDAVARIGGDEFLLICPDVTSPEHAQRFAHEIVEVLRQSLPVQGTTVSLSVSVGIEMHLPGTLLRAEDLIANADLAMYAAKRSGRNSVAVYDARLRAEAADRMSLEADLSGALTRGELFCAYQPVVDMSDGRLIGVETLARWTSDARGDVPPTTFIAAAEDNGQIGAVGEFVLRTACAQMAQWRATDPAWADVALAVNVSPRQLADPAFLTLVRQVLDETDVPVHQLWLEITEGAVVPNPSTARTTVTQLREWGVHIAIDDFGTGFSSLAQLRDLPADVLKIDRSFVTDLGHDPAAAGIIQAILTLARTLHLEVTAEGIETDGERQILMALGCRYGQGFLWSHPLRPEQLDRRAGSSWQPATSTRASRPQPERPAPLPSSAITPRRPHPRQAGCPVPGG